MFKTEDQARQEQKIKADSDRCFDAFMRAPTTRLIISTLPPMENPDTLNVLLRASFDAGHGAGGSSIAMTLIEGMINRKEKNL